MFRSLTFIRPPKFIVGSLLLSLIALFSAACGGDTSGTQPSANPTAVQVNGFGTAANHVHSLVVLPPNVLVLATHYGLFRSQDGGSSWQEVAGGSNQQMEGLMTYSLTYSSLNLWIDMCMRADCSAYFADPNALTRLRKAFDRAPEFVIHEREL